MSGHEPEFSPKIAALGRVQNQGTPILHQCTFEGGRFVGKRAKDGILARLSGRFQRASLPLFAAIFVAKQGVVRYNEGTMFF